MKSFSRFGAVLLLVAASAANLGVVAARARPQGNPQDNAAEATHLLQAGAHMDTIHMDLVTTQGVFGVDMRGALNVQMDSDAGDMVSQLRMRSSNMSAFYLVPQLSIDGSGSAPTAPLASGLVYLDLAMDRGIPDHTKPVARNPTQADRFSIPVRARLSFARHRYVHPQMPIGGPQTRAFTSLIGTLRCTVGSAAMVCEDLELHLRRPPADESRQFVQSLTLRFPGPLPLHTNANLLSSAELKSCYRKHTVTLNSVGASFPSVGELNAQFDKCCVDLAGYGGNTLSTSATQLSQFYSSLSSMHTQSINEGLPSGCDEIVAVFVGADIASSYHGLAFVTERLIIVKDESYADQTLVHEMAHAFELAHTDGYCTFGDIMDEDYPFTMTVGEDHCMWMRYSDYLTTTSASCTESPDTCL